MVFQMCVVWRTHVQRQRHLVSGEWTGDRVGSPCCSQPRVLEGWAGVACPLPGVKEEKEASGGHAVWDTVMDHLSVRPSTRVSGTLRGPANSVRVPPSGDTFGDSGHLPGPGRGASAQPSWAICWTTCRPPAGGGEEPALAAGALKSL